MILLVRLASRRLHTLPLPAWITIGLVGAVLALPWALRFYEAYWTLASGRPCGSVLEFLMPRVLG